MGQLGHQEENHDQIHPQPHIRSYILQWNTDTHWAKTTPYFPNPFPRYTGWSCDMRLQKKKLTSHYHQPYIAWPLNTSACQITHACIHPLYLSHRSHRLDPYKLTEPHTHTFFHPYLWKIHNGPELAAVSQFDKRGVLTDNVSEQQDHMAKVASNPQISLSPRQIFLCPSRDQDLVSYQLHHKRLLDHILFLPFHFPPQVCSVLLNTLKCSVFTIKRAQTGFLLWLYK